MNNLFKLFNIFINNIITMFQKLYIYVEQFRDYSEFIPLDNNNNTINTNNIINLVINNQFDKTPIYGKYISNIDGYNPLGWYTFKSIYTDQLKIK